MTARWQHVEALHRLIAETEFARHELVITAAPQRVMVEVAGAYGLQPRVFQRGTRGYALACAMLKGKEDEQQRL